MVAGTNETFLYMQVRWPSRPLRCVYITAAATASVTVLPPQGCGHWPLTGGRSSPSVAPSVATLTISTELMNIYNTQN